MSAIWDAAYNRFRPRLGEKTCYILYLGDHDPSGIDMTRDIEERANQFAMTNQKHAGDIIRVKRLALNMDQIEEYAPPPNPTKLSDSRAENYIDNYGEECYELDALEPTVIRDLIVAAVIELRDDSLWQQAVAEEEEHKHHLKAAATHWDEVAAFADKLAEDT